MSEICQGREGHGRELAWSVGGLAVAGLVAYQFFKPERHYEPGENYFDIIGNLDACVRSIDPTTAYFVLGGGVTDALKNPETVIDEENHLVIPPEDIYKPQYRKENGTLADVDILVASKDLSKVLAIRDALVPDRTLLQSSDEQAKRKELDKPGRRLKIGVTGLMSENELNHRPRTLREKFIHDITKDWVSQRIQLDDQSYKWAISNVEVDLPDEYFEPWRMVLKNGSTIPVLHPLIHVLCYAARPSYGIRRRDVDKVRSMMDNIGYRFAAGLQLDDKNQTASIELYGSANEGIKAAKEFCDSKNELRWSKTRQELGSYEAGLLAARIALHRMADKSKFLEQFGQGGWLFDHFLARFSGEQAIEYQPVRSTRDPGILQIMNNRCR